MTLYRWSQTPASNATADSSINWQEGQAPSSVNDSARAMMASIAKHRDDVAGAIVTGGTAVAYTVTSYEAFDTLTHLHGQVIAFTPHVTNAAIVTLNVDSLGAKPLRSAPSTELLNGTLIQGTPYVAVYNNSDATFYLQGFYGNPHNVPLGAGLDYWGATAPNSAFVIPVGQAISRTAYASLFNLFSTNYGPGDGSTTFNLPDRRGRVSAQLDPGGTVLTSAAMTPDGNTRGATGGLQVSTLSTPNLPPYTPLGSVSVSVTSTSGNIQNNVGGTASANLTGGATDYAQKNSTAITSTGTGIFTGTAQGGTSAPFTNVQPTIICNYIIRII